MNTFRYMSDPYPLIDVLALTFVNKKIYDLVLHCMIFVQKDF